ncbi:MAG: hypothetical protein ABGZ35_08415 [Planctomycetaceae bacterium]
MTSEESVSADQQLSTEAQPAQPEPSATDNQPSSGAAAAEKSSSTVSDGMAEDVGLAVKHHFAWVQPVQRFIERLFHYFFVGCVSLLGLCIAFLIPAVIAVCVAALLGIPGYLCYRWFSEPGEYFSTVTVIVTIFWTGYFVTHGWPRLRRLLTETWTRLQPVLNWFRQMLESVSKQDESD